MVRDNVVHWEIRIPPPILDPRVHQCSYAAEYTTTCAFRLSVWRRADVQKLRKKTKIYDVIFFSAIGDTLNSALLVLVMMRELDDFLKTLMKIAPVATYHKK